MTSRQDENLHINQMRRKLRTYSNQDYIFINSTNIHRYNAMYKIFKEITIKGINEPLAFIGRNGLTFIRHIKNLIWLSSQENGFASL